MVSFEEIARQEIPTLYRVAKRLTLNPTEAEDLVGQALLNASKGWGNFNGGYARSWFLRILRNCHLNNLRVQASRPKIAETDVDLQTEEPWGAIDWGLVGPRLMDELDHLPDEYRFAVALCDIEEMSYDEAAIVMDVPVGTAKSRVHRGRRILRSRLAGFDEGCQ